MKRSLTTLAVGAAVLTLTSCGMFDNIGTRTKEEAPVAAEQSYLQGGPNTEIELGQDERTLLEDYKKLNDTKIQLETQLGEVRTENEQLKSHLRRAEEERDQFRNHLAGSNQEGERISQRARDLEAKVLSLNIEKTLLEQELLRFRISSLRQQYDELVALPSTTDGVPR